MPRATDINTDMAWLRLFATPIGSAGHSLELKTTAPEGGSDVVPLPALGDEIVTSTILSTLALYRHNRGLRTGGR